MDNDGKVIRVAKLSDVFTAPDLFGAYPDLKNMKVVFKNLIAKKGYIAHGSYDKYLKRINVNQKVYKENKNDREIAKLLNCNSSVIQNYRKRKNLSKNFEYKSSLEDYFDKIIELKNQDKGYKTIAKELGLIPANVRYILKNITYLILKKNLKILYYQTFKKKC